MRKLKNIITVILLTMTFQAKAVIPVIDTEALIQLAHQLDELQQETNYLKQEVQSLDPRQYKWHDVHEAMTNLGIIVERAGGLGYTASNINEKFKKSFPGYQFRQDVINQYQKIANQTQDTLNGLLQYANQNLNELKNEKERLVSFQQQVMNAVGQTQAIQASAQITSEIVSQLQLLRQTVLSEINAQTVFYAHEVQKVANAKEELGKIIVEGSTNVSLNNSAGNTLTVPDFKI